MKITILQGPFLPVPALRGGAIEKAWLALGAHFASRGHEVVHLSRCFESLPAAEVIAGVSHRRVRGYDAPGSMRKRLFLDLLYTRRALAAAPQADILVTHTFWAPFLCRNRKKGRLYVHVGRYPKGQLRYYRKDAVLQTVSEPIRQAILKEVPTAQARCSVLPYPLAARHYKPHAENREKSILYTGRLHPEKGLELLVAAWTRVATELPDWRLRIVGPWLESQGGAGENYLKALKRLAGTTTLEFVGPIFDEAKLLAEYRRSSLFCYPSLAERGETFGLSVLEAMAGGAAPIVSALGCFGDFVRHNGNGMIFDHRSENAVGNLAEEMLRLAQDPELRHSLSKQALLSAEAYRIDRVGDRYLADFEKYLAPLNHG